MSDDITINIDGIDTSVPRGTLVIRAAENSESTSHVFATTRSWSQQAPAANASSTSKCPTVKATCGPCPNPKHPAPWQQATEWSSAPS